MPPSATISAPTMKPDSDEARCKTVVAISSGVTGHEDGLIFKAFHDDLP